MPTIEDYKMCQARTPGHRWDPYVTGSDWKPLFGKGVEWMCGRCDSVKRWTIDSNGKVYTQYLPSPGYRWWLDRGEPRPTTAELRQDVLDIVNAAALQGERLYAVPDARPKVRRKVQ